MAKDDLEVTDRQSLEWFAPSQIRVPRVLQTVRFEPVLVSQGQGLRLHHGRTLDRATGLRAAEHIHMGDKGDYYELTDDLPKRLR